jgi:hypothetical protein
MTTLTHMCDRLFLLLTASASALLLALPSGAAAADPPPEAVYPGQALSFAGGPGDLEVLFDLRGDCDKPLGGPVEYTWRVTAPGQSTVPEGQGETFAFSLTVADSPGFIFPVDIAVGATCGARSAFSASGRLGLFVIRALSPPPLPTPPPPFSGEQVDAYCELTVEGREVIVWVRGLSCDAARDILEKRARNGDCFSVASTKLGRRPALFICRARGTRAFFPGRSACSPVQYRGRVHEVRKQGVLCRYARATTLRILREDQPYIYEFEDPREGRRWRCLRRVVKQSVYGTCLKRVENRWIVFYPRV